MFCFVSNFRSSRIWCPSSHFYSIFWLSFLNPDFGRHFFSHFIIIIIIICLDYIYCFCFHVLNCNSLPLCWCNAQSFDLHYRNSFSCSDFLSVIVYIIVCFFFLLLLRLFTLSSFFVSTWTYVFVIFFGTKFVISSFFQQLLYLLCY